MRLLILLVFCCHLAFVRPTSTSDSQFSQTDKDSALRVIHEVLDLSTDLSSALAFLPKYGFAFGILGSILGTIQLFLPRPSDKKFDEIVAGIGEVDNKLQLVRERLNHLGEELKLEIKSAHIEGSIITLQNAITYSNKAVLEEKNSTREDNIKSLEDLCSGKKCIIAVNRLISSINGDISPLATGLLENVYEATKGDRVQIEEYSRFLSLLVYRGLIATMTNEVRNHNIDFINDTLKDLQPKLQRMSENILKTIGKSIINAPDNIKTDITEIIKENGPMGKETEIEKIRNLHEKKYSWLDMEILVYDNIHGSEKRCFDTRRSVSMYDSKNKVNILMFIRNHTNSSVSEPTRTIAKLSLDLNFGTEPKNATDVYMKMVTSFEGPTSSSEGPRRTYWGAAVIKKEGNVQFSDNTGHCFFMDDENSEFVRYICVMEGNEYFGEIKVNPDDINGAIKISSITELLLMTFITLLYLL